MQSRIISRISLVKLCSYLFVWQRTKCNLNLNLNPELVYLFMHLFVSQSQTLAHTFSPRLIDDKPMDSSFRKIGHLTLNRGMISRQKFLLVDVAYPLDGSIILNMKCFPKVVDQTCQIYRNFMSVYQMVDGYGSWPRFWCVLGNFQLKFYRYPEDEEIKV